MEKLKNILNNSENDETEVLVNNMIEGEIINERELGLIIFDVRSMEISEKLEMLRTGFQKLAYILETDERLKNIEIISGTSWIVAEHPKLMELLGFEVTTDESKFHTQKLEYDKRKGLHPDFKDKEAAYAYISKEKFLDIYKGMSGRTEKKIA